MDRRDLLGVVGGAVVPALAGCSSSETDYESGNTGESQSDSNSNGGSSGGGSSSNSQPDNPVELVEHELVRDKGEYTTELYVKGKVKNLTSKTLAYVQVNVRFFDDAGNQLTTGLDNVADLQADGTWSFKVMYIGTDASAVADYDIQAEVTDY